MLTCIHALVASRMPPLSRHGSLSRCNVESDARFDLRPRMKSEPRTVLQPGLGVRFLLGLVYWHDLKAAWLGVNFFLELSPCLPRISRKIVFDPQKAKESFICRRRRFASRKSNPLSPFTGTYRCPSSFSRSNCHQSLSIPCAIIPSLITSSSIDSCERCRGVCFGIASPFCRDPFLPVFPSKLVRAVFCERRSLGAFWED